MQVFRKKLNKNSLVYFAKTLEVPLFRKEGILIFLLLLSACFHKPVSIETSQNDGINSTEQIGQPTAISADQTNNDSGSVGSASSSDVGAEKAPPLEELPVFRLNDPEPPAVADQELDIIPVEINARVEQWITYFQGKGRGHMEKYLARSTRYMKLMKRILRQNGLPEDLIYVALIESGFSSRATSRAKAVGYWQFIKGTGRRYGLAVNALIDERRDPVLATQAAAEYFKDLYSVFGSWYLAMASYNVGENRVKREVVKHTTQDFWQLAKHNQLPAETINYVPKFIAAKLIANQPEKYGFIGIEYEDPLEFELVRIEHPVNLKQMALQMNLDYDDFKLLNPKYRGEIAPPKNQGLLELRVPLGHVASALNAAKMALPKQVRYIADAGETQSYRVRSGDSLDSLARKFNTTVSWLRDVNDLKPGRKLRIGMSLQVPERAGTNVLLKQTQTNTKKPTNEDKEKAQNAEMVTPEGIYYIVQKGDTLSEIAEEYDSSVRELRSMNGLTRGTLLKTGMKLKVPKEAAEQKIQSPGKAEGNIKSSTVKKMHIVRPGENLTSIAQKYRISLAELVRKNRLSKGSSLMVGSRLIIN